MTDTITRRSFNRIMAGASAWLTAGWRGTASSEIGAEKKSEDRRIDRHALVTRHNVVLETADIHSPLSVGNGEFAFTADITGLQTFSEDYRAGMPLGTVSQWGFHQAPDPHGFSLQKFPLTDIDSCGRKVGYLYYENGKTPKDLGAAADYLYANPGRLNLGRVALVLRHTDGSDATLSELTNIHQEMNLWAGSLTSQFHFDGRDVRVVTACHPHLAQLAVQISSPLIASGQLRAAIAFPYASGAWGGDGANWREAGKYRTVVTRSGAQRVDFDCELDGARYHAALQWAGDLAPLEQEPHRVELRGNPGCTSMSFTTAFAPSNLPSTLENAENVCSAASMMWARFWNTGAAIDLSRSKDPRWHELERRVVLSQYLTRIQSAGTLPPQETGLTCNSWFGKFHLEMHWWHAAHFALWGRQELLERSLPFYERILPKARATASSQGYQGARWPKCVGPSGDPAPSYLECFLIWQQPHPIFYAELCYRATPTHATLERYQQIVFETADFMASFACWDESAGQYRIGPPFADAAEIYFEDHDHQYDPTFEVAYWHWGLSVAQRWRERLGMQRQPKWDHVIAHLPPLTTRDGHYVAGATATDTFQNPAHTTSHPTLLAPLGMLDGTMADMTTMRNTLRLVMKEWDWKGTWGWDYPLIAMTAARCGEASTALDALLMPELKNTYLSNGHNFQMEHVLPLYLPGNGGLLYAVAMMAAGWDGGPQRNAPGFPEDGTWTVLHEGLHQAP